MTVSRANGWRARLGAERERFHLPAGLTAERAVQRYGRGVVDPSRMEGLHRLRREHPTQWHLIVWELTPGLRGASERTTVREFFSSRSVTQGMPRAANDFNRMKRYRASTRRVIEHMGPRRLLDHDDAQLERNRRFLSNTFAASTAARDLAVLRRGTRALAKKLGLPPPASARPRGPTRRVGGRRERGLTTPQDLERLLVELNASIRAAAALAAGAGLSEAEILGLEACDVDLIRGWVWVRTGRSRGRPHDVIRCEAIAPWALGLLRVCLPWASLTDPDALLFPMRGDESRPRSDLNRGFASASRRAFGASASRHTLGSCRRLWQFVMRETRLPRAAVRQSLPLERRGPGSAPMGAWWAAEQAAVIGRWQVLTGPPVPIREGARVPRKAAPEVGPHEPEIPNTPASRRRQSPLPSSCTAGLPPARSSTIEREALGESPGVGGGQRALVRGRAARRAAADSRQTVANEPSSASIDALRRDYRQQLDASERRTSRLITALGENLANWQPQKKKPVRQRPGAAAEMRRQIRTEVGRELDSRLGPVLSALRRLEQGQRRVAQAAFGGSAAGSLAGSAVAHPERFREVANKMLGVALEGDGGAEQAPLVLQDEATRDYWPNGGD